MKAFVILSQPEPKGGSFVKAVAFDENTAMARVRELNKTKAGHWYQENIVIGKAFPETQKPVFIRKTTIKTGGLGAWIYTYTIKWGSLESWPYSLECTDESMMYLINCIKLAGHPVVFRDEEPSTRPVEELKRMWLRDNYKQLSITESPDQFAGHSLYIVLDKDGNEITVCSDLKKFHVSPKVEVGI